MNLAGLVTAAATGSDAPLSLDLATALYAAVREDRRDMGLGAAPKTGDMPVTITTGDDGTITATVNGVLRYDVEPGSGGDITRLCTTPHCNGESSGRSVLTRVCRNHLDVIVPGMLPNAGDDIRPGDRENAAIESRAMRLDAWEVEAQEAMHTPAGDLRVIEKLRGQRV